MTLHFYDHLYEPDEIHVVLSQTNIAPHEKDHLGSLVRSTIHHDIMEQVLSRLPDEHKEPFLDHIALDQHAQAIALLAGHIDEVERLLRTIIDTHLEQLKDDVQSLVADTQK